MSSPQHVGPMLLVLQTARLLAAVIAGIAVIVPNRELAASSGTRVERRSRRPAALIAEAPQGACHRQGIDSPVVSSEPGFLPQSGRRELLAPAPAPTPAVPQRATYWSPPIENDQKEVQENQEPLEVVAPPLEIKRERIIPLPASKRLKAITWSSADSAYALKSFGSGTTSLIQVNVAGSTTTNRGRVSVRSRRLIADPSGVFVLADHRTFAFGRHGCFLFSEGQDEPLRWGGFSTAADSHNNLVALAHTDGHVRVYEMGVSEPGLTLTHNRVTVLKFLGPTTLISADVAGTLRFWNLNVGHLTGLIQLDGAIKSLQVSLGESELQALTNRSLYHVETQSGVIVSQIALPASLSEVAFLPNRTQLIGFQGRSLTLFDLNASRPTATVDTEADSILAVSPNGKRVITAPVTDCELATIWQVPDPAIQGDAEKPDESTCPPNGH